MHPRTAHRLREKFMCRHTSDIRQTVSQPNGYTPYGIDIAGAIFEANQIRTFFRELCKSVGFNNSLTSVVNDNAHIGGVADLTDSVCNAFLWCADRCGYFSG